MMEVTGSTERVTVLGAGAIGSAVARRLLAAGHEVVVWNRTVSRMTALVEAGALPAQSVREAARSSDLILLTLKDYSAVSYARIIIHEATHKYFNTEDEAYVHEDTYPTLSLPQTLNNVDSYAWAAVSLYCGAVKMGSRANYDRDWTRCS